MDDLDGSNNMDANFVYGDDVTFKENIHQINADLSYLHSTLYNVLLLLQNYHCGKWLESIIIWNIMYVCGIKI